MPSPKPLIFLDANVLFSAFHSFKGPAGTILEYFIESKLSVVVSQQVLEEIVRNLKLKLPESLPLFQKLLVNTPPMIVKNPSSAEIADWAQVINLEDASIIASAVAVQPDYLVTGDKHFFENSKIIERSGLRIVTPAQFIKEFKSP